MGSYTGWLIFQHDSAARVIKGMQRGDPKFDKENVSISGHTKNLERVRYRRTGIHNVNVVTYEIKVKGKMSLYQK